MKRIFLVLLVAVLSSMATWADVFQPQSGKLYVLHNVKCDGFFSATSVVVDGSAKTFSFQEKATPLTISVVSSSSSAVGGGPSAVSGSSSAVGGGFTLKTPEGQFVAPSTANTWDVIASDAPYTWDIQEVSEGSMTYYVMDQDGRQLGNSGNAGLGHGIFRGGASDHNVWKIEEYVAPEAEGYSVVVVGLTDGVEGGVVYGSTTYFGGQTIASENELTTGVVTAYAVAGYQGSVTLSGHTFTVTYRENVVQDNPAAIVALLDRIDTSKTLSQKLTTKLDESLFVDGRDQFVINGNSISGSSLVAIATGVNWFLNHRLHVNLTWNQLSADFSKVNISEVNNSEAEVHVCDADYRYYLNYCTFGYSMTTWTWERWQQEIDWMALHGINMPLQIVGLEEVWRRTLLKYNYTNAEAKAFAAGPAFTAWWGMNNLEGWGGTQDDAWFARQTALAQKINGRMREFGMEPVLPGFASTVPHDFTKKNPGYATESQGNWGSAFVRPFIMDPTSAKFAEVAATYYEALAEVMGTSKYYSMDPFHEGGAISSGKYAEGYRAIYDAMNDCCGSDTKWVIQQWQWAGYQGTSLNAVPAGRLIVLDLFADGNPAFDRYNGYAPQHAVYCTIPNFGGRTGLMGRLPKMADNYASYKKKYKTVRGIGAAPEAIEQTPVAYDLLFELPWVGAKVDTKAWVSEYSLSRYGVNNADAAAAWEVLRSTALNNTTTLQGPHEAVMCGRPGLTISKVSAWGGSDIFYDTQKFLKATYGLLSACEGDMTEIGAQNMSYDLCDVVRQSMSDYSKSLLAGLNSANTAKDDVLFGKRRDLFLQLILDTDRLLGTNRMFRLGNWTETARKAAAEIEGATTATPDWYELDNARTLITTWGDKQSSEWGLRDYSYRQWQGMLSDYYYPRWKYWFDHNMNAPAAGWFYSEWNWAHELESEWGASAKGESLKAQRTYYTSAPEGDTFEVARDVLSHYILPFTLTNGTEYYAYRGLENNCRMKYCANIPNGTEEFTLPFNVTADEVVSFCIDFDGNGSYSEYEVNDGGLTITMPETAKWGSRVNADVTLSDGTVITFRCLLPEAAAGIHTVQKTVPFGNAAGEVYDLQGRRASESAERLIIKQGKTTFVK